jgi:diguanylate cyclase (GGDEF)-like protein/PAS domain S-box-containing protein
VASAFRPRLRTLLFWSLLGLGLLPLATHLTLHAPEVLSLLESAVARDSRDRAEARAADVAQRLAHRAETTRIIATLPGPREILGAEADPGIPALSPEEAARRFTAVMARWLGPSREVAEVLLLDPSGVERLRLQRSADGRGLVRGADGRDRSEESFVREATAKPDEDRVVVAPEAETPAGRSPYLHVAAVIRQPSGQPTGLVALALDAGLALPHLDQGFWVLADGRYVASARDGRVSDDLPGVGERLLGHAPFTLGTAGQADLTWVPVTVAGRGQAVLWVAEAVDRESVTHWLSSVRLTTVLTTLLLLLAVTGIALYLTRKLQAFQERILAEVAALLSGSGPARFDWGGPPEVRDLARGLSTLAEQYRRALRERHEAESALLQEKERAQITLGSIADAVLATDRQGRIEFANPQALQLLAPGGGGLIGQPVDEAVRLIDGRTGHTLRGLGDPSAWGVGPAPTHGEVALLRDIGEPIPVEYTAAPIRDGAGREVGAVVVLRDVSQREELQRQLSHQANHDSLTGLTNRRAFDQRLTETLRSARALGGSHALLYVDLDQFKLVNDTCGHLAGDELLKQLARLMQSRVRSGDTLARLGGDEFGVLLENCPQEKAVAIAEDLLGLIREHRFRWQGTLFTVGASIGIATIDPARENGAEALSAADMACYVAKELGRGRVHLSRDSDRDMEQRRTEMQWVGHVKKALDEDRFVLYCQPVVPLRDTEHAPPHFEILVRMVDDHGKLIPPGAFIPAAERFNVMPALDRWVVDHAFAWMQTWVARLFTSPAPVFNINLSGNSLSDPGFLDYLAERARPLGPLCRSVCFEVTETAAITQLAGASDVIERLRALGFHFSLDDFGSGLSSFAYLKHLKVDSLKIDGLFIRDMHRDPVDLALVRAMNEVGHAMGIVTVAEYVESEEVVNLLRAVGVDYGQGYALAAPVPLSDLQPAEGPTGEHETRTASRIRAGGSG